MCVATGAGTNYYCVIDILRVHYPIVYFKHENVYCLVELPAKLDKGMSRGVLLPKTQIPYAVHYCSDVQWWCSVNGWTHRFIHASNGSGSYVKCELLHYLRGIIVYMWGIPIGQAGIGIAF